MGTLSIGINVSHSELDSLPPARPGYDGIRLHRFESDRLDSLASYEILDTPPEAAYDALTALAAKLCATPIAAVTLVDARRQWFKSLHGLDVTETSRDLSVCSDVVAAGRPLVVPDARADPRYADNPLVRHDPHLRAYAGVPLIGRDGLPLGALCVIDWQSRRFTHRQMHELSELAGQAVALLEQSRVDRSRGLLADSVAQHARDPARLRRALDDGEFVAHYQPIVGSADGRPQWAEALLRWRHPDLGTLLPAAFLPAIENSALVVPVGRAVLELALVQLADLDRQQAPLPGGMAVNVASGQLARPGFSRDVLAALDRHHVDGTRLAVEITEATALSDSALAVRELRTLADAGVHVVIDDFGVGWSNLARVLELPVSTIKLDRSIAGAVLCDPRAAAVLASTVRLAEDLGLYLVAEGVETEAVRRHIVSAGVEWAQGWLFGRAVEGDEVAALLRRLDAGAVTDLRNERLLSA